MDDRDAAPGGMMPYAPHGRVNHSAAHAMTQTDWAARETAGRDPFAAGAEGSAARNVAAHLQNRIHGPRKCVSPASLTWNTR